MCKKKWILFYLCLCSSFLLNSQSSTLEYSLKLTISDGLAHNGVTSVLEDSNGFLWFGTYEGVNRYDGYELQTFKNTLNNTILSSNRVRSLSEDVNGDIWIGTDDGMTVYDYDKQNFKRIYSNNVTDNNTNGKIIRKIFIVKNQKTVLALSEKKGLLLFDAKQKQYKETCFPEGNQYKDITFYNGIVFTSSKYILSTSKGLLVFDSTDKSFKKLLNDKITFSNSIIKINKETILVSLLGGIAEIKIDSHNISDAKLVDQNLENYRFNSMLLDASKNLWLGTLNDGIVKIEDFKSIIDLELKQKHLFKDNLPVLRTSTIVSTSNNNIWLGTFNEGLYNFNVVKNPFKTLNIKTNKNYVLSSNNITHIAKLDKNRLYLTSSLGGLGLFNIKKGVFESLPIDINNNDFKLVSAVFVDSKNYVWLYLKNKGIFCYAPNTRQPISINNLGFSFDSNTMIRSIAEDCFGNIWIGANDGVHRILINENHEIKSIDNLNKNPFFKDSNINLARIIYQDPNYDYLWIGTGSDGLFCLKQTNQSSIGQVDIKQYKKNSLKKFSLPSNFVSSLLRLPNGDFWLGTEGGGICKVMDLEKKAKFIPYSEEKGLSNNVVKTILYDNNHNLWIATNIGLNQYNPQSDTFRKFNISDGLAFEDFWFASKRLNDGTMLFSGLDGLTYFNPEDIAKSEELPGLQFENLSIFNKIVKPGDTINNRLLLSKRLSKQKEIILKHNENVFALDLTSLHFLNPRNHNLKYRLLPVSDAWVEVPSYQKTISYSGLQSGKYQLEAMASNSLNNWSTPKKLNIIIKPSTWKTNLAYAIYTFLGIFAIYLGGRIIWKIQALNHKVEIEQLEKNKAKDINEAKLRFFANISHELKTPLTLISRPLEVLSKTFYNNEEVLEKLNLMNRQSKKISQLIEQVHDFRRADANKLKMKYSRFNFNHFLNELLIDFKFLADNDDKIFEIITTNANIIVSGDKDKLEKILNNLLNNAFKYTRAKDTVKLVLKKEDKDLIVEVIDTGKGIEQRDLEHIFERFYQAKNRDNRHSSGSGIGLAFAKRLVEMHYGFIGAKSVLNEGTTITVRLPIVKKHLSTDILEEVDLPLEKEVPVTCEIIQENTSTDIMVSSALKEAVIFYAEDNHDMRNFVSKLLAKFFVVKSFSNGKDCYSAMEDEWPDIVISDVQMPEMNGLDLCLKVKSDLKTSHIPIILLTALTNIEDHLQGIKDGADAYIKKPFNVQQLVAITESLLIGRKKLRERYQVGIPLTKENNKNNRNDNAFLEKLYSLIEDNLDNQDFDLNHLARELYLNRTHFFQKVKVLTNQTPFELIKMYRIKKASEYLLHKEHSVNEVFAMTGFKSRTHFIKIFKEKYNVSPSKYAAEMEIKNRSNL